MTLVGWGGGSKLTAYDMQLFLGGGEGRPTAYDLESVGGEGSHTLLHVWFVPLKLPYLKIAVIFKNFG